jgi:hypothetical protein
MTGEEPVMLSIVRARSGLLRVFIILAVAAYGAAIVQNVTQMLQGFAHHHAAEPVARPPAR